MTQKRAESVQYQAISEKVEDSELKTSRRSPNDLNHLKTLQLPSNVGQWHWVAKFPEGVSKKVVGGKASSLRQLAEKHLGGTWEFGYDETRIRLRYVGPDARKIKTIKRKPKAAKPASQGLGGDADSGK